MIVLKTNYYYYLKQFTFSLSKNCILKVWSQIGTPLMGHKFTKSSDGFTINCDVADRKMEESFQDCIVLIFYFP